MWLRSTSVLALFGYTIACYAQVINTTCENPALVQNDHVVPHVVYEASMYEPFSRPSAPEPHSTPTWPPGHWSTASPFQPSYPSSASTPSPIPTPLPRDDLVTAVQVAVYQADLQVRFVVTSCGLLHMPKAIEVAHHGLDSKVAVLQRAISEIPAAGWLGSGMDYTDQSQLQWMAETSQAHRTLLVHLLTTWSPPQPAPYPCTYALPSVHSPPEFLEYMLLVLQNGISGLMGILAKGPPSEISVTVGGVLGGTQGLWQLIRQWRGLWPNPTVFPPVLPVTWHWTLILRDIGSCPSDNPVPNVDPSLMLGVVNMPVYGSRNPALNTLDHPSLTEPNSTLIRLRW